MKELSMHILDICQNSISANAKVVEITIVEDLIDDKLCINIKDDGKGMDSKTLEKVTDPFYTSRTTRKVGLGIPMFKAAAENTDGSFVIISKPQSGTEIKAVFRYSHIDRAPLGNIVDTMVTLILCNKEVDFLYRHYKNNKSYELDTKKIKNVLGDVPINNLEVIEWIKKDISEGLMVLDDKIKGKTRK